MNAIDRDALREWARKRIEFYQQFDSDFAKGRIAGLDELIEKIQFGAFDIKPPEVPDLKPGDQVRHKKEKAFIRGQVLEISKSGKTARVEWVEYDRDVFRHGAPWPAYYHIDKLEKVEDETHD